MNKNFERLAEKLAELDAKLESKKEQVSALLVAGRDASKVLADLRECQDEQAAVKMALEQVKSASLQDEKEKLEAERERAKGEALELERQALAVVAEILEDALISRSKVVEFFELKNRARALIETYQPERRFYGYGAESRYVVAARDMCHHMKNMLKLEESFSSSELSKKYAEQFED